MPNVLVMHLRLFENAGDPAELERPNVSPSGPGIDSADNQDGAASRDRASAGRHSTDEFRFGLEPANFDQPKHFKEPTGPAEATAAAQTVFPHKTASFRTNLSTATRQPTPPAGETAAPPKTPG